MIVKDEDRVLATTLECLQPFVDDVVVYDTGSIDSTRDVAAAHGARVVEGYWDDDFAAARNRALAHVTAGWVISIDADEEITGDPSSLRRCAKSDRVDLFELDIVSTSTSGAHDGPAMRVARLFRRAAVRWEGALHEQLVPRHGARPVRRSALGPSIQLLHSGYRDDVMQSKLKPQRNLGIARRAFDPAVPRTAADYGRALVVAGAVPEGLDVLASLLERPADSRSMVLAARTAVPLLIQGRHGAAARAWVAAADRHGESAGQLSVWRSALALAEGSEQEARVHLAGIEAELDAAIGRDPWGLRFDTGPAVVLLTALDTAAGDHSSASRRIVRELHRAPERINLPHAFMTLSAAGWSMRDLVRAAPPAFLDRALREMSAVDTPSALSWFREQSLAHPDDPRPVVAGNVIAARTDWRTALEWSIAAREHGLEAVCALSDLTQQEGPAVPERALGLAFLAEGFGDPAARARLADLASGLPDDEARSVRAMIGQHVPSALPMLERV